MNKLMIANLKMNLTLEEIINYKQVIENNPIPNLLICPSSIHLSLLKSDKYELCSQNGYHIDKGAYTGENSFYQLKNLGINYSLIGHSERRNVFNEDDNLILLKVESCIKNGMIPILCIGEKKEERESGETFSVIEKQINTALSNKSVENIIIAYEPVWAIGTGLTPTIDDIEKVHLYIKNILKDVKVLYGGSVNLSNIKEICSVDAVDGVLIGGASNNPNNLIEMYNVM